MKVTEQIKLPIYKEMELFEKKFSNSMSSKVALLNRITNFIKLQTIHYSCSLVDHKPHQYLFL